MILLQPTFKIEDCNKVLRNIERAARRCYKSEDKMCQGSDIAIIEKILTPKHGIKHESVLEHGVITVSSVFDRGVSHEMVRHRHAAYSQESTRYCNYSKDKYGNQISLIDPFFFSTDDLPQVVEIPDLEFVGSEQSPTPALTPGGRSYLMTAFDVWMVSCMWAEWSYVVLTQQFKRSAQEARSVLPNSLKTEIEVTANIREWRHILNLRTGRDAHPQIRQVMVPLGHALAERWPVLFGEFLSAEHTHPAQQIF